MPDDVAETFDGANVRVARLYHGYSLDDVAQEVNKTRQYIYKIESGDATPSAALSDLLADALQVDAGFFYAKHKALISEDSVHFRKLVSTRATVKQIAIAKAEMLRRVVDLLDDLLDLPPVSIRETACSGSIDEIERIAERCRSDWGLGSGPIANMTRVAENAGAIVTTFSGISPQVDALSIPLKRPFIVRNEAKESVCRMRFDIGHELAHLVLHVGRTTGDRSTEQEANRFSSALLLPRSMMAKFFPRPRYGRLDWIGLSEFKLTWKASKAAILYRAHQLGLIDDSQYRTGFITLKRTGEAVHERGDDQIAQEPPELLQNALGVLRESVGIDLKWLADKLYLSERLLRDLLHISSDFVSSTNRNVIPFPILIRSRQ